MVDGFKNISLVILSFNMRKMSFLKEETLMGYGPKTNGKTV